MMAAMSGGVDSSVCALLLQQAGYDVRGATMVARFWATPGKAKGRRVGRRAMWKMRGQCAGVSAFPTMPSICAIVSMRRW